MSSAPALGIDFGTTNSSMAWLDHAGEPKVILNAEGESKTPSVVFFDEAEVLVGRAAIERLEDEGDDPEMATRAVRSIKRNLLHPPILSLPGGRDVRPVEVVGAVLRKLKKDAEEGLFREPVRKAVITHPAEFDAPQKDVLREAAIQGAAFEEIDLVPEPVAAALAFSRMDCKSRKGILVYDLGGGTFDVAVIARQEDGSYGIPLPPDGDQHCGGDDFDQALYDYCDRLAQKNLGLSVAKAEGILNVEFLTKCRKRKENLTKLARCNFSTMLSGGTRFEHMVERSTFEELIRGWIESTIRRTQRMVKSSHVLGIEIDAVVLIGGSSRIPLVSREIEKALAIAPLIWENTDFAVALGAACCTQRRIAVPSPQPRSTARLAIINKTPPSTTLQGRGVTASFIEEMRQVLACYARHQDFVLLNSEALPEKLGAAIQRCNIPPEETLVGVIYGTSSPATAILVFGAEGVYYYNGATALRPGVGEILYPSFFSIKFLPADGMEEVWMGRQAFDTAATFIGKSKVAEILNAVKSLVISSKNA